ncbi:MAG TPA: plastocyanin/azurin family copper-binding protein [Acidimicrobiales bacterium]|nr:plastocyanin/azurin family copper-binding protein [Acidimicrobiales bacterium]
MKRPATRALIGLVALCVAATGLASCGSGSNSDTLTIETDYDHDEFAGTLAAYFPNSFTVKPGMTVKFHQTWTGEAHTVTLGTRVTELAAPARDVLDELYKTGVVPKEEPESLGPFFEKLPFFFGEKGVNQTAAQPCSALKVDEIPTDGAACKDKTLAPFTGREAYYNSGFIPFEGPRGNTFEMEIAEDAKPGKYIYYCNLHGLPMGGNLTITEDGETSTQSELNRQGKREADRMATQLLDVYRKEKAERGEIKGNLAGSGDESTAEVYGSVNEFTPRTIEARTGEKVTWTFINRHSISFNVPKYAPIFTIEDDGKVVSNDLVNDTAGGWPGRTPPLPESFDAPEPEPVTIDAGEFDGTGGLKSSGVEWATGDKYSVTFTKAGTYPYACLIHPGMIGKVVVK